jgi:hypothetical protein
MHVNMPLVYCIYSSFIHLAPVIINVLERQHLTTMRLRLGGTVVKVERVGVLTCLLFSSILFAIALYAIVKQSRITSSNEARESIQPTPIDQLLQRVMNDRRFDDVDERFVKESRPKKTQSDSSMAKSKGIAPTYGTLRAS